MNRVFTVIARIYRQANSLLRTRLPEVWDELMNNNPEDQTVAVVLKSVLEESFPNATEIEIKNSSEVCQRVYEYKVVIETDELQGLSLVQQHRLVCAAAALALPKHDLKLYKYEYVVCLPTQN